MLSRVTLVRRVHRDPAWLRGVLRIGATARGIPTAPTSRPFVQRRMSVLGASSKQQREQQQCRHGLATLSRAPFSSEDLSPDRGRPAWASLAAVCPPQTRDSSAAYSHRRAAADLPRSFSQHALPLRLSIAAADTTVHSVRAILQPLWSISRSPLKRCPMKSWGPSVGQI